MSAWKVKLISLNSPILSDFFLYIIINHKLINFFYSFSSRVAVRNVICNYHYQREEAGIGEGLQEAYELLRFIGCVSDSDVWLSIDNSKCNFSTLQLHK